MVKTFYSLYVLSKNMQTNKNIYKKKKLISLQYVCMHCKYINAIISIKNI